MGSLETWASERKVTATKWQEQRAERWVGVLCLFTIC